jgi:hypothetical protein
MQHSHHADANMTRSLTPHPDGGHFSCDLVHYDGYLHKGDPITEIRNWQFLAPSWIPYPTIVGNYEAVGTYSGSPLYLKGPSSGVDQFGNNCHVLFCMVDAGYNKSWALTSCFYSVIGEQLSFTNCYGVGRNDWHPSGVPPNSGWRFWTQCTRPGTNEPVMTWRIFAGAYFSPIELSSMLDSGSVSQAVPPPSAVPMPTPIMSRPVSIVGRPICGQALPPVAFAMPPQPMMTMPASTVGRPMQAHCQGYVSQTASWLQPQHGHDQQSHDDTGATHLHVPHGHDYQVHEATGDSHLPAARFPPEPPAPLVPVEEHRSAAAPRAVPVEEHKVAAPPPAVPVEEPIDVEAPTTPPKAQPKAGRSVLLPKSKGLQFGGGYPVPKPPVNVPPPVPVPDRGPVMLTPKPPPRAPTDEEIAQHDADLPQSHHGTRRPPPPPPPPIAGPWGCSTEGGSHKKVKRAGWFNKCQKLAKAIIDLDMDLAYQLGEEYYVQPSSSSSQQIGDDNWWDEPVTSIGNVDE